MNPDEIQNAEDNIVREYEGGLQNVIQALDPPSHYVVSYPSLVRVSRHLCEQANDNGESRIDAVTAIAHMAYGWMPTTLKRCDTEGQGHQDGRTILHAYQIQAYQQAIDFIQGFTGSPINNSWTGLSKALHFINPEVFPIWDSNVAMNFRNNANRNLIYGWANNKNRYICCIDWCHSVLDPGNNSENAVTIRKAVTEVQGLFDRHAGYGISRIRALEFTLFTIGRNL